MLEHRDKCHINKIRDSDYETSILGRLYNVEMLEVALEVLKYASYENINYINTYNENPLIRACIHKNSILALKILERMDRSRLGLIYFKENALIIACVNKMSDVALKILDYQYEFDVDIGYNNTALTHACKNSMVKRCKI